MAVTARYIPSRVAMEVSTAIMSFDLLGRNTYRRATSEGELDTHVENGAQVRQLGYYREDGREVVTLGQAGHQHWHLAPYSVHSQPRSDPEH